MIEIRIHGRGGQGAVVASEILAKAFFKEGKYIQSFPHFGVERRGAPVAAFVRVGDPGSLFVRTNIYEPDHIIVLDPTLLTAVNVMEGLKPGGWIVVNTPQSPEELVEEVGIPPMYKVATVDATSIAIKHGLGSKMTPIVNTAILGAFVRAFGQPSLENLLAAIKEEVPVKPEENAAAAREAYESTKILVPQEV